MKPATVAALREAGAEEVWIGVESGSQRILDAMDKGTRIDQIRTATRALREHGIRTGWFIQLGYLGEEWDEILLTRDLIREERPDEIGVSVSYPLPGTGFYEIVKRQLGDKHNWNDSGELAMMFAGTFDTGFYREVRDVLHAEVDAYRAGRDPEAECQDRWDELAGRQSQHRRAMADEAVGAACTRGTRPSTCGAKTGRASPSAMGASRRSPPRTPLASASARGCSSPG
jgi:anaerobic magnesium-protoporphyrin IX monomethyl ester cyclase